MRALAKGLGVLFLFCLCCCGGNLSAGVEDFESDIYPANWKNDVLYMCKDFPQNISIYMKGNRTERPKELSILLDLPDGMEIVDVLVHINGLGTFIKDKVYSRNGVNYTRYRIGVSEGGISRITAAKKYYNTYVWVILKSKKEGKGRMFWCIEADGACGKQREMPVETYPAIPEGKTPKKEIVTYMLGCYYVGGISNEHTFKEEIFPALQRAGFNHCYYAPGKFLDYIRQKGMPCIGIAYGIKRGCPTKYIQSKGESDPNGLGILNRAIKGYDEITIDYEPHSPMCLCNDCIASFRKWAKLGDEKLDKEIIKSKYRAKFAGFNAWQNGQISGIWKKRCNDSGKLFHLCSGVGAEGILSDSGARRYYLTHGIDYHEYDGKADYFTPMTYYSARRMLEVTEALNREVKTPIIPLAHVLSIAEDGLMRGCGSGRELYMRMIAGAIGGGGGISLWPAVGLDGDTWRAVAQANHEVALIEDFLGPAPEKPDWIEIEGLPLRSKRIKAGDQWLSFDFPKWRNALVPRMLSQGKRKLLVVFNFGDKELFFKIRLKDLAEHGYVLYNPVKDEHIVSVKGSSVFTKEDLARGVSFSLEANNVLFLELSPEKLAKKGKPLYEKDILQRYEKLKKKETGSIDLEPQRSGKVSISWDDENKDLVPEIVLENAEEKLWINIDSGGRVQRWEVSGSDENLVFWNERKGGIALDLFWLPIDARWSGEEVMPYELIEKRIDEKGAHIRLRRELTSKMLRGLVIEKEILIPGKGKEISFSYTITNKRKVPVRISLWSKHGMQVGSKKLKALGKTSLEGADMLLPFADGVHSFRGTAGIKEFVKGIPEGMKKEGFGKDNGYTGKWASVYNPDTKEAIVAAFNKEDLMQFYSWRGEPPTFELLFRPYDLKSGESWKTAFKMQYLINPDYNNLGL